MPALQAIVIKGGLDTRIEELEAEIAELKGQVSSGMSLCEGLEFREAEKARSYEEEDKEIAALKLEEQQLRELLATLQLSKPDKGEKGK